MKLEQTVRAGHNTYFAGELNVSEGEEAQIKAAIKEQQAAQTAQERAMAKAGSAPAPSDDEEETINDDPDADKSSGSGTGSSKSTSTAKKSE